MIRILLIAMLLFAQPVFAEVVTLDAYTATYAVKYHGIKLGSLHLTLTPADDNTYVYETTATPGFWASLVVSKNAVERSVIRIDEQGVRPLTWFSEDGKKKTENDGQLNFDWTGKLVTGTVEEEAVELPAEPGLQDRLSMQIEVLVAMLRDQQPGTVKMIDGNRVKSYSYQRKEAARIETEAGTYDTVLYESTREGSSRLKRIYHAPQLGYLPVRIENLKNGKLDTVMELVEVSPKSGAAITAKVARQAESTAAAQVGPEVTKEP